MEEEGKRSEANDVLFWSVTVLGKNENYVTKMCPITDANIPRAKLVQNVARNRC